MRPLIGIFQIDSALVSAAATRAWTGLAGIVTLLFISRFLGSVEQGYYYAFWSLLALQSFVELGLLVVIVSVASHEWAHLSMSGRGRLEGPPRHVARLIAFGRFVVAWFCLLTLLFVLVAGGFNGSQLLLERMLAGKRDAQVGDRLVDVRHVAGTEQRLGKHDANERLLRRKCHRLPQ